MKNIDLLAKAVAPEAPAPAPAPQQIDPNQIAGDLIDKIAARVVELLGQQNTDPEPEAPDPEPEAGGDTDDSGQSGEVD